MSRRSPGRAVASLVAGCEGVEPVALVCLGLALLTTAPVTAQVGEPRDGAVQGVEGGEVSPGR